MHSGMEQDCQLGSCPLTLSCSLTCSYLTGAQVGSLPYMAPELVHGGPPPSLALADRTDVWAVGVLAFQLLAGELPWHHEVPTLLRAMIAEAAVPYQVSWEGAVILAAVMLGCCMPCSGSAVHHVSQG